MATNNLMQQQNLAMQPGTNSWSKFSAPYAGGRAEGPGTNAYAAVMGGNDSDAWLKKGQEFNQAWNDITFRSPMTGGVGQSDSNVSWEQLQKNQAAKEAWQNQQYAALRGQMDQFFGTNNSANPYTVTPYDFGGSGQASTGYEPSGNWFLDQVRQESANSNAVRADAMKKAGMAPDFQGQHFDPATGGYVYDDPNRPMYYGMGNSATQAAPMASAQPTASSANWGSPSSPYSGSTALNQPANPGLTGGGSYQPSATTGPKVASTYSTPATSSQQPNMLQAQTTPTAANSRGTYGSGGSSNQGWGSFVNTLNQWSKQRKAPA